MGKYKIGLQNVLMGNKAADGDAGLTLTAVGDTVSGTAQMAQTDNTTAEFNIEESDSPVLSIVTVAGLTTATWSSYNNSADQLVRLFGGTKVAAVTGAVSVLGAITAGSGYVNGTYVGVPLTGGVGSNATADITVAGGAVTGVVIRKGGSGYANASNLSASNVNLGGTGSGFQVVVTTVAAVGESWEAPDSAAEIEQTVKFVLKTGGFVLLPRAKIAAKLTMSFKKDALSQIDIVATVLQPEKAGVPRMIIQDGN